MRVVLSQQTPVMVLVSNGIKTISLETYVEALRNKDGEIDCYRVRMHVLDRLKFWW